MHDTATNDDVRWEIIEIALIKAGVDTKKINTAMKRRLVLRSAEAEGVVGEDADAWQDFADGLIAEHPTWASPKYTRRWHAAELIDSWENRGTSEDGATADDLMGAKYALVSWYDGRSFVHKCGDNYRDIAETVVMLTHLEEYPESPEFFMDLDTGKAHHLYGPNPVPMQVEIKYTICGETYTYQSDNTKKEQ